MTDNITIEPSEQQHLGDGRPAMTRRSDDWTYENPGDLDRTGRCRECEALYTRPHVEGCSYGPGKVGALRRRPLTELERRIAR